MCHQDEARHRRLLATNGRLRAERDQLRQQIETDSDVMHAQRTQIDALTTRITKVEGERDRMFEDGHAAALAVSRVRHLAERWATDPNLDGRPGARQVVDGLVAQMLVALDGGEQS